MSATKIPPLAQQPAYKTAIGKVVDIGRALSETTVLLERTRSAVSEIENRASHALGAIDRAMALANGDHLPANLVPPTLSMEVRRLEEEERALREGLRAASLAAEGVARQLAREIGQQARERHVAAVKEIREALRQLERANAAEEAIRTDLEKLGYDSHGLPHSGITKLGTVDDQSGSPAYYYMRETAEYIGRK